MMRWVFINITYFSCLFADSISKYNLRLMEKKTAGKTIVHGKTVVLTNDLYKS